MGAMGNLFINNQSQSQSQSQSRSQSQGQSQFQTHSQSQIQRSIWDIYANNLYGYALMKKLP